MELAFLITLALCLAFYFLPTIIACNRQRQAVPIFLLNLFLGWTLVGWVIALAWAFTDKPHPVVIKEIVSTPRENDVGEDESIFKKIKLTINYHGKDGSESTKKHRNKSVFS